MQPLFKLLHVRLLFASALCARVLLFITGVAALAEARRGLSVTSPPPRPVRASLDSGDFDIFAALNILEPLSFSLQSCHGTFKEGSNSSLLESNDCVAAATASNSDTEWDKCSLLTTKETPSLRAAVQLLQCLQPCLARVVVIFHAEAQHISVQQRGDVGTADKVADTACSQLAAGGSCVSTVLQSLTLILTALCQHKAAAVVSYIPQTCAESGHALTDSYAEDPIALLATIPSNCPTEANISFCSQEQLDGHSCPQILCSMLCAVSGASGLSVTGYKTLSSNNSASKVSAHRATLISVVALGVFSLLLMLFLGWKLRQLWLCSCCLPDPDQMPSVETQDLLRVAQAARSRSQTPASGFQTEHVVKKAFDRLPGYIAAKLAGSRQARQHKTRSRQRAGSPSRLTASPRGSRSPRRSRSPRCIQMTSCSKKAQKDRHAAHQKAHDRWDDPSLENSMRRSDDSTEALIGVEADHYDPQLMQSDSQEMGDCHLGSQTSSVSLTLTEQYSIASCSYPPLSLAELEDVADNLLLDATQDTEGLEGIVVDE